jgi:hypothetical protein
MSRRTSRSSVRATAVVLAGAVAQLGCARHVTLDPESVASRNVSDWTIRAVPSATIVAGDGTAAAASVPITPLPFRQRPEVAAALATPPDAFGVPEGLYAADPLLSDHRKEMASQASARRSVGVGLTIFGLVFGGLAVWGFSEGQARLDSSNDQIRQSGNQLVASAVIVGALSLGEIVAGTVLMLSSSDPAALQRYYRETYAATGR